MTGATLLLMTASLSAAGIAQDATELKPGKGRELVALACTQCHTADIILASRMSRSTWDTTLTWMQETQGLAELEPETRALILDYLELTQGLDEADDDGASSPWASPLYRPNPIW